MQEAVTLRNDLFSVLPNPPNRITACSCASITPYCAPEMADVREVFFEKA